ncbi:MAG: MASE1 domain-containing protein [Spirochaetes bacterium]|nr:MASE1 domain-containing protein [Spirochaetota bacterium]
MKPEDNQIESNREFPRLKFTLMMIATAITYLVVARLSLLLAVGNSNATSVWPPSGIALAVILIWGYRMGPAVFLGAFLANIATLMGTGLAPAYSITASFTTAVGNMLEGIVGAYLIRRFTRKENPFDDIKDLFVFILFGSLAATMISSTIGVTSYCYTTGKWPLYTHLWFTWWLGDTVGVLIVSPIIILLKKSRIKIIKGKQIPEAVVLFVILTVSCIMIFSGNTNLEFVVIPPLLWIAFRFGRLFSAVAVLFVSMIAVIITIITTDPASNHISNESLLYLQTYFGVISIINLSVSVLEYMRGKSDRFRIAMQKQLYDIIEFLPDATFAIDKNGAVIAWNRAMENLVGISKSEMLGKDNYEYAIPFYGERRPILIDLVMNTSAQTRPNTYEYMERKGSTLFAEQFNETLNRYLASAASELIDSNGTVFGAIESIRDITARKDAERDLKHYKDHLEELVKERNDELVKTNEQLLKQIEYQEKAEKALFESEKKYRDLVESANSVIMRWKQDGSITFLNTYALKFFGFTESEIIGKNVVGTIVPAVESTGRDLSLLIEDIVRTPDTHALNENENTKKNGERVWLAWTNKPIYDESGSIIEILSVGNDITARKNMEESLKNMLNELGIAKERAEAADRLKSAFLATMSHELRTPLNSIIGFTGIILQKLAGPLNEEQERQLGMVQSSAQHLLSLINDVLDISKIEAGQLEVYAEQFNAHDAIDKVIKIMKPLADKKGLAIVVNLGHDIEEAVGDRRRVDQVLLNLLSNAVKFTERGRIAIDASVVPDYMPGGTTSESPFPHPAIRISVSDTGIGIRPKDLKDLFQPFRQLDTGLSRKNEGTGLGLAICRRLARLMGGEIIAESEWGRGSVFTFIIPIRRVEMK